MTAKLPKIRVLCIQVAPDPEHQFVATNSRHPRGRTLTSVVWLTHPFPARDATATAKRRHEEMIWSVRHSLRTRGGKEFYLHSVDGVPMLGLVNRPKPSTQLAAEAGRQAHPIAD